VICQRADMAVGTARSDDQGVGDRGLALQVDADNVLGLVVVEAFDDQAFQRFQLLIRRGGEAGTLRFGVGEGGRSRRGVFRRALRDLTRQCQGSFLSRTGMSLTQKGRPVIRLYNQVIKIC
jgi:hypothetical protein